jgi:acyl-coenzyme A synthetase/AMP-(fatty) acid ligase
MNHTNQFASLYNHDSLHTHGYKAFPTQCASIPYSGHLYFGDKKDLILPHQKNELEKIVDYLASNRPKYQQFLRQKGRYPSLDIYACFQPFNEAFKALYPFIKLIKASVKDGDVIVNLWDRSGWTANFLAGLFPKQHIITVWEGDKDILGYRGFDYWMSSQRQANQTILFADFLRPLPIEDGIAAAVIGFDLLHRFYQPELLSNINRIARANAPVIFPHVHLTNNMPEPFFERGCRQLHGNDYQYLFEKLSKVTNREGYIFSEPFLFDWNDKSPEKTMKAKSEPSHTDYNACIAWLPKGEVTLEAWRGHLESNWEEMYLLQNPLLEINNTTHTVQLYEKAFDNTLQAFLSRHPVYANRIKETIGSSITTQLIEVLYWAKHGLPLSDIIQKTGVTVEIMSEMLQKLWDMDLAQAVPVNEAGFRLQTLLCQQEYILERSEDNLHAFWKQSVNFYGQEQWAQIAGEEGLTYEQSDELIELLKKALLAQGVQKGDHLLLCTGLHTETLLLFWAAVSSGIIVVPISPKESPHRIKGFVDSIKPSFALVDPCLFNSFTDAGCNKVIMTDLIADTLYKEESSFQTWLELSLEQEVQLDVTIPLYNDVAVILWTTGSTGNPKGIPITHQQLIRSGRLMTETYHWKKKDRYYALGGLEAMSGLRHATVSVAEAGACCIIPNKQDTIFDHLDTIIAEKISIITANPIFFRQLLLSSKGKLNNRSIRLALCTGNQLPAELRESWKKDTGIPMYNYYGLTETTGMCIAEPLKFEAKHKDSIGIPVDSLVKIIDENGEKVENEQVGELCIYGAGVFNGYYNNEEATQNALQNGWFYTKDLAVQHTDGTISLCGRISNMVKLSTGERVDISAIEETLVNLKHLKDWAVCIISRDEKEDIGVFFVPEENTQYNEQPGLIKELIRSKIGQYAVPALIQPVSFIPRGNHNKVLHKQLIDQYFKTIKIK